jgi:nitroreductase
VCIVSSDGIRLDDPTSGRRDLVGRQDIRKKVSKLMEDRDAPVVLLLIGDRETLSRSSKRIGYTRSEPIMTAILYADAAVIAQNVYLAGVALGLGTGIVADLDTAFILSALGLDPGRFVPIFALPVGKPASEPVHGAPAGPTDPGLPGRGPAGLDEALQE